MNEIFPINDINIVNKDICNNSQFSYERGVPELFWTEFQMTQVSQEGRNLIPNKASQG